MSKTYTAKVSVSHKTAKGANGQSKNLHNAKHNDRSEKAKREHIDYDKTSKNVVYKANSIGKLHKCNIENANLHEQELAFYKQHFTHELERINENYIKQRKASKVKTMEQFMKDKNRSINELVIQIGDKDYKESGFRSDLERAKDLERVVKESIKEIKRKYKSFEVLNWSLHVDEEGAEHVHLAYLLVDKESNPEGWTFGKERALANDNTPLPDPSKPESRKNNRTMTFTKDIREIIENNAEKYVPGLIVDKERAVRNAHSLEDWKKLKDKEKEIQHEENELARRQAKFDEMQQMQDFKDKKRQRKDKELQEKDKALSEREERFNNRLEEVQEDYKAKYAEISRLKEQYEQEHKEKLEQLEQQQEEARKALKTARELESRIKEAVGRWDIQEKMTGIADKYIKMANEEVEREKIKKLSELDSITKTSKPELSEVEKYFMAKRSREKQEREYDIKHYGYSKSDDELEY